MHLEKLFRPVQKVVNVFEPAASSYWITRFFLFRSLGLIYCIAFLAILDQWIPLLGNDGLLPVANYLDHAAEAIRKSGESPITHLPTVFWANSSDLFVMSCAFVGLAAASLLTAGYANAILMVFLWLLYMSYVHVGQTWYSFGWETMTLEATFLAILLCPTWRGSPFPRNSPPSKIVIWFYRWMLFRVMFGAGLIKLRGDPCWREFTCLIFHYETQPIPHMLSWHAHHFPELIHKIGVLWNHFVELIVPWFFFGTRRIRIAGGLLTASFQILLILSGNLSWLNWLTLALCIPCFDDQFLSRFIPMRTWARIVDNNTQSRMSLMRRVVIFAVTVLLLYLSMEPVQNMMSPHQIMNTSFDRLHLMNTYGAFGHVGKVRYEIVLQGTSDSIPSASSHWLEYEFKGKPTDLERRPPFVAPYHLRLDWLIWFAAMSRVQNHPWLLHLTYKLLQNDQAAISLIERNPFPESPPVHIRAELYRYEFTDPGNDTGAWWQRQRERAYFPPLALDSPNLRQFIQAYGWPLAEKVNQE